MRRFVCTQILSVLLVGSVSAPAAVDFSRDVQPIFARHCFECHGAELQKGKLRLDRRESALPPGSDVIVPGKAANSELFRRITLPKGHDDIMPSRGEPLSAAQIEVVRQWINQGAVWPENAAVARHWAYVKPTRPTVPKVKGRKWIRNPIDSFILARLEKEKLRPSPEADRATLLRRVYLALIGLPPSPEEVHQFVSDRSSDAYDKVVDRLLNSPQYGERWARPWLDLARYADSSGYQRDNLWDLWPYRDWVIRAINRDMPFDQFTIEQLAGDLLPNATIEQKVATGFNRCVPTNVEAGADQEETRVTQVFDRVNTLGAVWLGTTLECAQCHNHKYDPITQKDYYRLFAFFNNTPKETDLRTAKSTASLKMTGPYMDLPDATMEARRKMLLARMDELSRQFGVRSNEVVRLQPVWEKRLRSENLGGSQTHVLDMADVDVESGSSYRLLEDKSVLLTKGDNEAVAPRDTYTITATTNLNRITAFKLEVMTDPSLPGGGPGRGDEKNPNFVLTDFTVTMSSPGKTPSPIKLRRATASFSQVNFPVRSAIDDSPRSGWGIRPEFFKDHWAIFETEQPIDGSGGKTFVFRLEQNNGTSRLIGRMRLSVITGIADPNSIPADIAEILRQPPATLSASAQKRLQNYHLSLDSTLEKLKTDRAKLQDELRSLKPPQTMVMQEMPEGRMSSTFVRGNFLERGEPVQAGTPALLHELPSGPLNRLTLARWLVDTNNPLVARVTVNRWWSEFFGQALVPTPEDFGIKGDLPTHPELLDWLAMEFMDNGWSMKKLHRVIVMSATFRQSSKVTPKLLEKDDQNKLYARGPRFRMEAEMIRDHALAVSGLLSLKQGGVPVRPYQPPGLWESKVGGDAVSYTLSEGEDRYRRGIYTVWKRTSPYPSFVNFDATERTACTVKRSRSNTPLQALTLLNDPVYVEAAAAMTRRFLRDTPSSSIRDRLRHAMFLCLGREGSPKEIKVLEQLYREQLAAAQNDPKSVQKVFAEIKVSDAVSLPEFSAWHAVAWALLNLHETITRS